MRGGLGGVAVVVTLILVSGCGGSSGTKFKTGDCISVQTNNKGAAVRADDCKSRGAIKIERLAEGGVRPDCGTGWDPTKETTAVYVRDLQTDVTYCGF